VDLRKRARTAGGIVTPPPVEKRPMNWTRLTLSTLLLFAGCSKPAAPPVPTPARPAAATAAPTAEIKLVDARKGFQTKPVKRSDEKEKVAEPPPKVFQIVHYESAVGKLPAYLTPDPKDGKKHPAVVWITGGDCNSIGDVWKPAPPNNDQTASGIRKTGIVMMFPSLRGGNDNPGEREGFFGEVDDVIAAADFLAKQEYVDPQRVYLGGHSTGGTLVLLTAECTDRFRATFSFGPVASPAHNYPPEFTPFNTKDQREAELRAPILWLQDIRSPVFVFEGAREGNIEFLQAMQENCKNAKVHFLTMQRADHFSILFPMTRLIAAKILADSGPACNIEFTPEEVNRPVGRTNARPPAGKGKQPAP
jgi:dienelactone hydrolase